MADGLGLGEPIHLGGGLDDLVRARPGVKDRRPQLRLPPHGPVKVAYTPAVNLLPPAALDLGQLISVHESPAGRPACRLITPPCLLAAPGHPGGNIVTHAA